MKKFLIILLLLIVSITLAGCEEEKNSINDINNGNTTVEESTYTLSDFENDVKAKVNDIEKSEVYFQLIGAVDGFKLHSGDSRLEIYKYDKNSSDYKLAEQHQQITMQDFGSFDATVKNGYALIIDEDFPNKQEIENLFNKLK